MGRCIDADELKRYVVDVSSNVLCEWDTLGVLDAIDKVKTVDTESIPRAHWKINCDGYYSYCSRCGCEPTSRQMTKFCDHCGAKMDEEV